MRELNSAEIMSVSGSDFSWFSLCVFSGLSTGLGLAAVTNVTAEVALMMVTASTTVALLIGFL